jgi:hypothetical protein
MKLSAGHGINPDPWQAKNSPATKTNMPISSSSDFIFSPNIMPRAASRCRTRPLPEAIA